MITTTIDLAHLKETDPALLRKLFHCNDKHTDVYFKDKKYLIDSKNTTTKKQQLQTIILTHDVIKRPRNKNPAEIRYEVIDHHDKIGEGGFSKVYNVLCTLAPVADDKLIVKKNKQRVAKIQTHKQEELKELDNEIYLSHKAGNLHIKCPAVIKLDNGKYLSYSVMRKLAGTDLYSVMTQLYSNALTLSTYQRLTISMRLLEQLKRLHANGIIHRDLKPDNVMIDLNSGELEIFDYGLSKTIDVDDTDSLQGTPGFIPLEVYANKGTSVKSDIFSMSIVIAMLFFADEPGTTPDDIKNYKFEKIFSDPTIDLSEAEKNEILTTLINMSKEERDERYTVDKALAIFTELRESYVNRQIDEMMANRTKPYRIENGLFVNNVKPKIRNEAPAKKDLRAYNSI